MDTNDINNTESAGREKGNGGGRYFLIGALVLAVLFIIGVFAWGGSHRSPTPTATSTPSTSTAAATSTADIATANDPFLGSASAPVTIDFWSDFQCPFCKNFELDTLPQIIKNYVDTGEARIVFLDYAFLGNDSITGAEYSHAVWSLYPKQYFAWRTAMYNAQDAEGDVGFGNAKTIDALDATIPGIDADKVAANVQANASIYQTMIATDKAQADKVSINATPAFLIGTKVILGAYPFDTFKSAIDAMIPQGAATTTAQ